VLLLLIMVVFVACQNETYNFVDIPKLQEHKLNFFDKLNYFAQQIKLSFIISEGYPAIPPTIFSDKQTSDTFYKAAKILRLVTQEKKEHEKLFADKIVIDNLDGYMFQFGETCHLTLSKYDIDSYCLNSVEIDEKFWQKHLDIAGTLFMYRGSPPEKIKSNGMIRIRMNICKNYDEAMTTPLEMMILWHGYPIDHRLQLYKFDQGPGDVCLLDVIDDSKARWWGGRTTALTDRRVAFVRGNVAVYLWSSYKHIGCWDLACKIDTALVEQMKKKEREKPPEQKTGNDEKNNGKTE
jgi:hypothetical protein